MQGVCLAQYQSELLQASTNYLSVLGKSVVCGRVGKKLIDVECRAGGVMRPPDREYKQNTTSDSCSAVTRGDTRPDGMCPRCSHHYKCGTHSTTIVSIPHIIWSLYIYILHYHRYVHMEIFYHIVILLQYDTIWSCARCYHYYWHYFYLSR